MNRRKLLKTAIVAAAIPFLANANDARLTNFDTIWQQLHQYNRFRNAAVFAKGPEKNYFEDQKTAKGEELWRFNDSADRINLTSFKDFAEYSDRNGKVYLKRESASRQGVENLFLGNIVDSSEKEFSLDINGEKRRSNYKIRVFEQEAPTIDNLAKNPVPTFYGLWVPENQTMYVNQTVIENKVKDIFEKCSKLSEKNTPVNDFEDMLEMDLYRNAVEQASKNNPIIYSVMPEKAFRMTLVPELIRETEDHEKIHTVLPDEGKVRYAEFLTYVYEIANSPKFNAGALLTVVDNNYFWTKMKEATKSESTHQIKERFIRMSAQERSEMAGEIFYNAVK